MSSNTTHKMIIKIISVLLSLSLVWGVYAYPMCQIDAATSPKTLTLYAAKKLAVANSAAIEKLEMQLETKQASLSSAIKSIAVKKKNMSTFRWTPLLKFKFPTQPDLAEAYEFQFKPIKIQYEIDKINHKITDQVLAEYEKVNSLYLDIVVYQYKIDFNEGRAEVLADAIEKNQIKLLAGKASQSDIDTMQAKLDAVNSSLSEDERSITQSKKKLSNIIGIDVTTNYDFKDPFIEAELDRSLLADLTQYTLDRDDAYYEVCLDETSSRVSAQTNYTLMKNHYPSKYINMISPYVDTVFSGGKVKAKAFKSKYKEFVGIVNEKWNGKKRILFIKIPKKWFQGAIDGDRFIEDDPYTLYEDVMSYQEAQISRQQAKDELIATVEDSFNNYISVRNSYKSYVEQVAKAQEDLEKAAILNKAGELTYEEYKETADSYEELQNSLIDSMNSYAQTLYSLDRLTCGGVTYYLGELDADLNSAGGGESYVLEEYAEGAHYYIRTIIQEEQFQLGVNIPEDFELSLTDYELWVDNVQIGKRTPIDKVLRHLSLSLNGNERVFLRFYDGNDFIDDVEIDADTYSGPLNIVKDYVVSSTEVKDVGTYNLMKNDTTGLYKIDFTMNDGESVAYYKVKDIKGDYLVNDSLKKIDTSFSYLSAINGSLGTLQIEFYDEAENLLYTAHFDTKLLKIIKNEGEQ